jgi:hypothetical protein
MAAFVGWLAPQYESVHAEIHTRVEAIRDGLGMSGHRRTPEIVANLMLGIDLFLAFLLDTETISEIERDAFRSRAVKGIVAAARSHEARIGEVNPAHQFIEYLRSALASGRAHVAGHDGKAPAGHATALGWRRGEQEHLFPGGDRVGWVEGEDLYLDSRAVFGVVQRVARDGGEALPEGLDTVKRRLRDAGLLASVDSRGGAVRLEVRRVLDGDRRLVLHLRLDSIVDSVAQVAHEGQGADTDADERGPSGPRGGGCGPQAAVRNSLSSHELADASEANGPVGPLPFEGWDTPDDGSEGLMFRGPSDPTELAHESPESGPSTPDGWTEVA